MLETFKNLALTNYSVHVQNKVAWKINLYSEVYTSPTLHYLNEISKVLLSYSACNSFSFAASFAILFSILSLLLRSLRSRSYSLARTTCSAKAHLWKISFSRLQPLVNTFSLFFWQSLNLQSNEHFQNMWNNISNIEELVSRKKHIFQIQQQQINKKCMNKRSHIRLEQLKRSERQRQTV